MTELCLYRERFGSDIFDQGKKPNSLLREAGIGVNKQQTWENGICLVVVGSIVPEQNFFANHDHWTRNPLDLHKYLRGSDLILHEACVFKYGGLTCVWLIENIPSNVKLICPKSVFLFFCVCWSEVFVDVHLREHIRDGGSAKNIVTRCGCF